MNTITESDAYKAYSDYQSAEYASEEDFTDTFVGEYDTKKAFAEE